MRACIFANGELHDLEGAKQLIESNDLLVAADGGARHCRAMGIVPDVIVGDMDSVSAEVLLHFENAGAQVIRHNPDKDETDLELALLYAQANQANEALVLGALGNRWDHTLANLLLPTYGKLSGLPVNFWADGTWFYLVNAEQKIEGDPGETVSLIPLGGDADGVQTEGLAWPLEDETLFFGSTRGVSNRLEEPTAVVRVRRGWLLVVVGNNDD